MKEMQMMEALGSVKDEFILEAAPGKRARKQKSFRWLAAALILALGMTAFLQTAPGAAAAEFVKEQVVSLIQRLFPPQEMTAYPEGEAVSGAYVADGQEPAMEAAGPKPGFALYYDPSSYAMTEENGVFYIRGLPVTPSREEIRADNQGLLAGLSAEEAEKETDRLLAQKMAFYQGLPPCEIEILHLAGLCPEDAAKKMRAEKGEWETVSAIEAYEPLDGFTFHAANGTTWDAPVEDVYFISDGQQGVWQLTVRYFLEAAEGHGMRMITMINSFSVLPPQ